MSVHETSFDASSESGYQQNKSPDELSPNIDTNKNISKGEVYQIIKQFNLPYNNSETENLLEEIGINKQETIVLENLIEKSKEKRKNSKFIDFYDKILNMFITPYEKIIQILNEVKSKLTEIKEDRMAKDIQWVIKKINNEDIYNLNVEQIKLSNTNNYSNKSGMELENTFNFLTEYSKNPSDQNKKADISAVRRISDERCAVINDNQNLLSRSPSIARKSMVYNNVYFQNSILSPDENKTKTAKNSILYTMPSGKFSLTSNSSTKNQFLRKSSQIPIKEEEDDYNTHNNNIDLKNDKKLSDASKRNSKFISNFNEEEQDENIIKSSLLNINYDKDIINLKKVESCLEYMDQTDNEHFIGEENKLDFENVFRRNEGLDIDSPDFNVFEYSDSCGRDNVLINVSDQIFMKYLLYTLIDKRCFVTFIDKIRLGYDYLLPYHNDLHATDVLQTCFMFTDVSDLKNGLDLTMLDLAGFFIAAIGHDFKHPGLNNMYHINKNTCYAIKYNDISVLENYHVSSAFKVISHPNSNIFRNLQIEEYRVVRKRIVECVLATDMAKHTKSQSSLKMKIEQVKNKKNNSVIQNLVNSATDDDKFDRQQEVLNFLIHCSDISNQTKNFALCKEWTRLVTEEFFSQGDREKSEKLPVSFLCDRNTTNIPKSQIGFITNIVLPCYKVLTQLLPSCGFLLKNLYSDLENWKKLDEENSNIISVKQIEN